MKISAQGHRRALKFYLGDGALLGAFLLWYLRAGDAITFAVAAGAISAVSIIALMNLDRLAAAHAKYLSTALLIPYALMTLIAMLSIMAPLSPDWEGGPVRGAMEILHWFGFLLAMLNAAVLLNFLREIWTAIEPQP